MGTKRKRATIADPMRAVDPAGPGVTSHRSLVTSHVPELDTDYLFGEITDERACAIVEGIEIARARGDRYRLWICSLGGDLGGALAIHDALARCPDSEAIATGHCLSAALVAFLGAEKRWCTPNTIFQNHKIEGARGEPWPEEVGLPAIKILGGIRTGVFGPELAKEFGITLVQEVMKEVASG